MKNKRQDKILKIIAENDINTQEELISKLAESGFAVTQATVSRDIRELRIIKAASAEGGYKYVAPSGNDEKGLHAYSAAFTASVRSVEPAGNLVVIKTFPGLANAVAASIDTLGDIGIVGCVAGDDTIFAATGSAEAAESAADSIRNLIKD